MNYSPLAPFVSSGLLFDKSPESFTVGNTNYNPLLFDGIQDSLCTRDIFNSLNRFFYYASLDTSNTFLWHPDDLENSLYMLEEETERVSFGLMNFDYNFIDSLAFHNGYLSIDSASQTIYADTGWVHKSDSILVLNPQINSQTGDTIGYDSVYVAADTSYFTHPDSVALNAFGSMKLFAAAALTDVIVVNSPNTELDFRIPNTHYLNPDQTSSNNYYLALNGIWQPIPWNPGSPRLINNWVEGRNEIWIRYGGSPTEGLITKTEVFVYINEFPADYQQEVFEPTCPDLDTSAGVGSGVVSFRYNPTHNGKLIKPIVIIEGLDFAKPQPRYWNTNYDFDRGFGSVQSQSKEYGAVSYNRFAAGAFPPNTFEHAMKNAPKLLEELNNAGYDIIFVDFQSNRGDLKKNANYVKLLIQYLNEELESNESTEQLVLLGMGTGAIASRIALREMELEGCCHNTRVYTSFDGPHNGLNIPLGLQAFFQRINTDLSYETNISGIKNIIPISKMTESTVFAQLGVYQIQSYNAAIRDSFQAYLDVLGYPRHTQNFTLQMGEIRELILAN
ncbi:MAG: hypothetical protein JJU11_18435 [Candidatus Sumerlaeia bacterium]|nr:hypothetical protein [Candidatus Sumerlaeia bacterium]